MGQRCCAICKRDQDSPNHERRTEALVPDSNEVSGTTFRISSNNRVSRQSASNQPVIVFPSSTDDIYTKDELRLLLSKAEGFVYSRRSTKAKLTYFYRDKSKDYYEDIRRNKNGIMQVNKKDYHGDPKSPINGRLYGLFMSVNVQYGTSLPVYASVYGEERLLFDPEKMYQQCPNLYFTDFYCIHKPHYVTLVTTSPGSQADLFCQRHLVKLRWDRNAFLERRLDYFGGSPKYYVVHCGLWVEVFFTEDIYIQDATVNYVEMKGLRSGGTVGLRKNSYCEICNL